MPHVTDREWYVYLLSDPRTMEPKYIGWTIDVDRRLAEHIRHAKGGRTYKDHWLGQLKSQDMKPMINILESGIGDDWAVAEMKWIKYYKKSGEVLTNSTDGGEGVLGYKPSQDQIDRMLCTRSQREYPPKVMSPEARQKISDANRGRKNSPEHVAKVIAFHTGRIASEETKEKMRIAHTGLKHTQEAKDKVSNANKGRPRSEESKAKMRESQKKRFERERQEGTGRYA